LPSLLEFVLSDEFDTSNKIQGVTKAIETNCRRLRLLVVDNGIASFGDFQHALPKLNKLELVIMQIDKRSECFDLPTGFGQSLSSLSSLRVLYFSHFVNCAEDEMTIVADSCPKLQGLYLGQAEVSLIRKFLIQCPDLRVLFIYREGGGARWIRMGSLFRGMKQLKLESLCLYTAKSEFVDWSECCPRLREFYTWYIEPWVVESLLRSALPIHTLEFADGGLDETTSALLTTPSVLPQLTSLRIRFRTKCDVSDETLTAIRKARPRLDLHAKEPSLFHFSRSCIRAGIKYSF
jgi:hypothetical protein